jgi:pimeloyl-ACP methyl ester carboxylesterase
MLTQVNDIQMQYGLHGPITGHPLMLIHGFPLTSELWHPIVPALSERYRLILPDLRGHGKTQATQHSSMGQYAKDLIALLEVILEPRPVVLVGMSMGGYIALEFLRRYPDCVRALVLVDTRAEADTPEILEQRQKVAQALQQAGLPAIVDPLSERLFAESSPEELKQSWRAIISATPPTGAIAALSAMAGRPDSTGMLPEIDVPTLVIVGEQDQITPPEQAQAMAESIPGAQFEVLPEAGHMSAVEQPTAFAQCLEAFLGQL